MCQAVFLELLQILVNLHKDFVSGIIIPVLQMRTWRHAEVRGLAKVSQLISEEVRI